MMPTIGVVWQVQAGAQLVPASAVADHQGMGAGCDGCTDLTQVLDHGFGVDRRHDDGGADASLGTDGAEQVHRIMAVVAHHRRARADRSPDIGMPAFLTHSGLILEPHLDRLARR
jgi:hypothetical protein